MKIKSLVEKMGGVQRFTFEPLIPTSSKLQPAQNPSVLTQGVCGTHARGFCFSDGLTIFFEVV